MDCDTDADAGQTGVAVLAALVRDDQRQQISEQHQMQSVAAFVHIGVGQIVDGVCIRLAPAER